MLPQHVYEDLKKLLEQQFHQPVDAISFQSVGGGSINQTCKLSFSSRPVFCKINNAAKYPHLLLKEKQSLEALCRTGAVKTPRVIAHAVLDTYQVLILEWIESGSKTPQFFKTFGEQLALLHQHTTEQFGWETDNYMGSVLQQNNFNPDWNDFFIIQRLEPLVQQCLQTNLLSSKEHGLFKKLYERMPLFFDDGEKPALVHGDLWNGNYMCNDENEPVLIDPAAYYGHRSMDIAMTTLFGGFYKEFYEAYQYQFPLPKNYDEQTRLCNLYPLLIHLLLFGRGYLTPIQQTLTHFL